MLPWYIYVCGIQSMLCLSHRAAAAAHGKRYSWREPDFVARAVTTSAKNILRVTSLEHMLSKFATILKLICTGTACSAQRLQSAPSAEFLQPAWLHRSPRHHSLTILLPLSPPTFATVAYAKHV